MDREAEQVYTFGDYRLDVARRVLTRSTGELVELKPRVFDVLRHLVEHAGELVEKKALLAAVWPGVVVEEHNLNKSVSMLRRVLGDDPDAQEYIATIPGRGYQFVHRITTSVVRERASADPLDEPTRLRRQARGSTVGRVMALVLVITGSAAAFVWQKTPRAPSDENPPTRALLDVRPAEGLYGSSASPRPARTAIRLSPDGRTIVFAGVRDGVFQLFRRRLDEPQATPIPGTERAVAPFFSPDGEWLGFWQAGHFRRVPSTGGPAMDIGPVDGGGEVGPMGASWSANGLIVYAMPMPRVGGGIWSIPVGGGPAERVTEPDPSSPEAHRLPFALPNGRAMIFTVTPSHPESRARLVLHRFDTGEQRVLLDDAADGRYLSSGHLLFMRRGTLMAVAFDGQRGEILSTPVPVVGDVMQAVDQPNGLDETFAGQYDAAAGTLVYLPGGRHPPLQHELVWVSRDGAETPFALDAGSFLTPRLSPDGRLVAYTKATTGIASGDTWVYDVGRGTSRRITFDGGFWPLWSGDGTRLIFVQPGVGLRSIGVDERAPPTTIPDTLNFRPVPSSWVGSTLFTVALGNGIYSELWSVSMDRPERAKRFLWGDYMLQAPALSPDGRWLAYVSAEAGAPDVYVQRYPAGGAPVRVSMSGSHSPRWTRQGRELVFARYIAERDVTQMLAAAVDTSDDFRFESPRVLFEGRYALAVPAPGYDVSPDGETFVMTRPAAAEPFVTTMNLVLGWDTELEGRVRTQ
jgi:serine/threonine-protein kinase